jgi:hypothetical protein
MINRDTNRASTAHRASTTPEAHRWHALQALISHRMLTDACGWPRRCAVSCGGRVAPVRVSARTFVEGIGG